MFGPWAFVAGILVSSGSSIRWISVVPLVWFIGMIISHMVFNRCVLLEIISRLKRIRPRDYLHQVSYAMPTYKLVRFPDKKLIAVQEFKPETGVLVGMPKRKII